VHDLLKQIRATARNNRDFDGVVGREKIARPRIE
jgi:hypothetical protein